MNSSAVGKRNRKQNKDRSAPLIWGLSGVRRAAWTIFGMGCSNPGLKLKKKGPRSGVVLQNCGPNCAHFRRSSNPYFCNETEHSAHARQVRSVRMGVWLSSPQRPPNWRQIAKLTATTIGMIGSTQPCGSSNGFSSGGQSGTFVNIAQHKVWGLWV
jgi:hypothetical protein